MPIINIPSVIEHGILSFNEVKRRNIKHTSVANNEVQKRRNKKITNGPFLHDCANLYFDARNPMMFVRKKESQNICVLEVSDKILKIDGVVLSDRNASADDRWVQYLAPKDINELNFSKIYAQYWITQGHSNRCVCGECHGKRSIKSAEVLVPNCVPFKYIIKAHVVNDKAKINLEDKGFNLEISITPNMFFC